MRSEPLRALIALEWIAMISAFMLDIIFVLAHVNSNPKDPRSLAIFIAVFCVAAAAIFSCPHTPHRRYFAVVIALLASGALMDVPTQTSSSLFLLLILAARLTFAFGSRGAALAWAVGVISEVAGIAWDYAMKPTESNLTQASASAFLWGLLFTFFFGLIGIMSLYARKSIETATEAERTRIALDLHDSLGHTLTTLNVHLQNAIALNEVDKQKTRLYLERAGNLAISALDDVRETVTILHDDDAEQFPVTQLLEQLRTDFTAALSINLEWNVRMDEDLQGRSAMALYRIVQEALTNIVRHAHARNVSVRIATSKQTVEVHISDDGRGFSEEHGDGHGLISMRNRIESLGGTITIESCEGAGTRIDLTFPTAGNA